LATAVAPGVAIDTGDSFGNYEIVCEIGEGGMGIVYLAEQIHPMHREVALKVVKPGMETALLLRRFESERQALALMQHPNIAILHDAGTSAKGHPYFVMEFVDGLPITVACDRQRCTIAERLALFAEVCSAVEHAHCKGVVHRDLKPANVLVTERDGRRIPKVIDFGVAKAAGIHLTGRTVATSFGEFLGTPDYMSPEQASFEPKAIGPASDVYSLGVLLYELLTGVLPVDPARLRNVDVAVAVRIIREEAAPPPLVRLRETGTLPDAAALRKTDPANLERILSGGLARVLKACLEKDPRLRYSSVASLAEDVERYLRGEAIRTQGSHILRRLRIGLRRYRRPAILAGAAIVVLAVASLFLRAPPNTPLEAAPLTTYPGSETCPSFSPDAKELVFAWDGEREQNWDIYRLRIGAAEPQRLTSSEAVEYSPAWSPDGKWIAFLRSEAGATAHLTLMPESGGVARDLRAASFNIDPRDRRLAWSADSHWLIWAHNDSGGQRQRLFAVSAATGEERPVAGTGYATSMAEGQPAISADGRALLFARDAETPGQLWILPLTPNLGAAGPQRRIFAGGLANKENGTPIFLSSREMLFTSPAHGGRALFRASLSGDRQPVEFPELGGNVDTPELSSDGRKLVFVREAYDSNVWCLHLDAPAGKETGRERVLASTLRDQNAALSPDGKTLAFESNRGGSIEIWRASREGLNTRQLTSVGQTSSPRWSPDGKQIVFDGNSAGKTAIYAIPADGGTPRKLVSDPTDTVQPIWSPDGKWIYYCSSRSGQREIWRIPADGGTPEQVTRHGGFDLVFSPDRRWIYYGRLRVSSAPIWRRATEGGEEQMLIDSSIDGHVFATSRYLYYNRRISGKKCQIVAYDLASRRSKVLATTDRAIRERLAVSADERSIYFTQMDDDGVDLMLVSHFH
jgi:Tol biopolymer transport system component